MKTIEVKLYSFNELSQEAKEKAIQNHRNNGLEYFWNEENLQSLKAFCKVFDIDLKKYSIDSYGHSYVDTSLNASEDVLNLSGVRLLKYLWNNFRTDIYKGKYYFVKSEQALKHKRVKSQTLKNGKIFNSYRSAIQLESSCPFTGYCMDEDLLEPVFKFMALPLNSVTYEDLLNDCIESWLSAAVKDLEYQESDEFIGEHLEANEYEFTEDGELF